VGEFGTPRTPASYTHVTVTPGHYDAGGFERIFTGDNWRALWTTPLRVPVFTLEAHGLEFDKPGGGSQTVTVHVIEKGGWREYRFRSVDKFPLRAMPPEMRNTIVGDLIVDQNSAAFPAAPLLVPPLLRAIGALHVYPRLYVLGSTPALGEMRDSVAGMLGTFELKGEEGPDDTPGFAGSRDIEGTDDFLEKLASSRAHRLDEREFLAVRLVDILINDPDRTRDNFDWARFGSEGAYIWRPIARDRDRAFNDARGLLNAHVVRRIYPKHVAWGARIDLNGLTDGTFMLDRRLLQRLTADDFRAVAQRVQRALTDDVIEQVVAQLPREWRDRTDAPARLRAGLRARREALGDVAMAFYRDLATDVDIHGTDEADRVDVVRRDDGRVTVIVTDPVRPPVVVAERRPDGTVVTTSAGALPGPGDRGTYYQRTFVPGETDEVRIHTGKGNDVAMVHGAAGPIAVRIIGGEGDDVLTDAAAGGSTHLYDADGQNSFRVASRTRVSTRPWKMLEHNLTGFRVGGDWVPDWGGSRGWGPAFDFHAGELIVGGGPRWKSHGFRTVPHAWRASANLLVGTESGRLGFTFDADTRAENSPRELRLSGRITQLDATRFHGYGNDAPEVDNSFSQVDQRVIAVEPALVWHVGYRAREGLGNPIKGDSAVRYVGMRPLEGELRVGPSLAWYDPEPEIGSPLLTSGVTGSESFGLAGARVGLELDRTDADAVPTLGWKLEGDVAAYPALAGLDDAFGTATARGSVYLPLRRVERPGSVPHVALRAGGALAGGNVPVQLAPSVGGRSSLRGYSWRRFAGDAAAHGSAELRVPVTTVNFLVRSRLGFFALADAGRVWFDGASPGGWHYGLGGGIWLASLGQALSLAYVHGEAGRLYVKRGMFF
jgi:hypothetical protein